MEASGTLVIPLREYVRSRFPKRYDEWFASLSTESKPIIEWCLPAEWYPLGHAVIAPTRRICELFHAGDMRKARDIGRFSADYALTGFMRIFMKLGSPHFILARGSHVVARYYRPCRIRVLDARDRSCKIQLVEFDEPHDLVEQRIAGWLERAVEIAGKKPRRVDITQSLARGGSVTEFAVEWE
jgi:hypothetical protein